MEDLVDFVVVLSLEQLVLPMRILKLLAETYPCLRFFLLVRVFLSANDWFYPVVFFELLDD